MLSWLLNRPDPKVTPSAGSIWTNHTSSIRIGSGCDRLECSGSTSASVPPGPKYKCWGSLELPVKSGKLVRFLPEVDMQLVHHMILYGGHGCAGRLLYAWARTGQTAPIGLDLDSWGDGFGYEIGKGLSHISLQIHYQQQSRVPTTDRSGLRMWYSTEQPKRPVNLAINSESWRLGSYRRLRTPSWAPDAALT